MTFSQQAKTEVLKNVKHIKGCCATSFLTAILKASGSLTLGFHGFSFSIESDNPEFLSLAENIAQNQLGTKSHISTTNVNAKGTPVYNCEFEGSIGERLGLTHKDIDGSLNFCDDVYSLIPKDACCQKAFMQGLFLACGSVVIPLADSDFGETTLRGKYHLELRLLPDFAKAIMSTYGFLGLKYTERKTHVILYLKESEKIADFLVYVNATKAKLKLENVIIGRSIRNTANRQSNCISANIDRSLQAGEKQLAAIMKLKKLGVFETLPENLKQVAAVREEFPEANLEEIAARLGISKSGVNHRLKKIVDIAADKK